jgi:hypothetical protein
LTTAYVIIDPFPGWLVPGPGPASRSPKAKLLRMEGFVQDGKKPPGATILRAADRTTQ